MTERKDGWKEGPTDLQISLYPLSIWVSYLYIHVHNIILQLHHIIQCDFYVCYIFYYCLAFFQFTLTL